MSESTSACLFCDSDLPKRRPGPGRKRLYCDQLCRRAAQTTLRRVEPTGTCRCGTVFERSPRAGNPKQWCSPRCRAAYLRYGEVRPALSDRELTCPCGKTFVPKSGGAKRCDECRYRPATPRQDDCLQCGTTYQTLLPPERQKYCSAKCREEANRKRPSRHRSYEEQREQIERSARDVRSCVDCGKDFVYHPKIRVRFCSRDCAKRWRRQQAKPEPEPRPLHGPPTPKPLFGPPDPKQCPHCDCPFPGKSTSSFCSKRCRDRAYQQTHRPAPGPVCEVACPECGTTFRQTSTSQKFCLPKCAGKAQRRNRKNRMKAQDEGTAESFTTLEIAERDGWRCQLANVGGCVAQRRKVKPATGQGEDPWGWSLDHLVPRSHAGYHQRVNVQLAHRRCNRLRGNTGAAQLFLLDPGVNDARSSSEAA